jgi:hypothetical protein
MVAVKNGRTVFITSVRDRLRLSDRPLAAQRTDFFFTLRGQRFLASKSLIPTAGFYSFLPGFGDLKENS